jgi:hypothetical protein
MNRNKMIVGKKIAVWFSCGGASAVAAKLTIDKYGKDNEVIVCNTSIKEEDEDNRRFLNDVENWIGQKVEIVNSSKFPNQSAVEVWDKVNYMSGIHGAPCTKQLKKEARYEWQATPKKRVPIKERLDKISEKIKNRYSMRMEEIDLHEVYCIGKSESAAHTINDSKGEQDGWISVDKELPREGQCVLVYTKKDNIEKAWLWNDLQFTHRQDYHWGYRDVDGSGRLEETEVTHWQPLPKAPKVEK